MWLLGTTSFELHNFVTDIPDYVILSHTWGFEEVSFEDIRKPHVRSNLQGFDKIVGCCEQAIQDGFAWAWIDTCCIDKRSSAELSEAINSMYDWYWQAAKCFAYIEDVPHPRSFEKSVWFERGWTLQELLAPAQVEFYDTGWNLIGSKLELADQIETATGIDKQYILDRRLLDNASVATKFSWASRRKTTRKEDVAYCLLGLVGVNMPMLYGEDHKAFHRLQLELLKKSTEHSIFAWEIPAGHKQQLPTLALAPSPRYFRDSANIEPYQAERSDQTFTHEVTNNGLRISLPYTGTIAWLRCQIDRCFVGIKLAQDPRTGRYVRVDALLYYQNRVQASVEDMYLEVEDKSIREGIREQPDSDASHIQISAIHTYLGWRVDGMSLSDQLGTWQREIFGIWLDKGQDESEPSRNPYLPIGYVDVKMGGTAHVVNELQVRDGTIACVRLTSASSSQVASGIGIIFGLLNSQPILYLTEEVTDILEKDWFKALNSDISTKSFIFRHYARAGGSNFDHEARARLGQEGTALVWSVTIRAVNQHDRRAFYGKSPSHLEAIHQEDNLACTCAHCQWNKIVTNEHSTTAKRFRSRYLETHFVECNCPTCAKESKLEVGKSEHSRK